MADDAGGPFVLAAFAKVGLGAYRGLSAIRTPSSLGDGVGAVDLSLLGVKFLALISEFSSGNVKFEHRKLFEVGQDDTFGAACGDGHMEPGREVEEQIGR